jgi:hydroxyacylglutathione hydrolase
MLNKNSIKVQAIAAYADNYIWLLSDSHCAVVVDPGDAEPVIAFLKDQQLSLEAILITHHHADHIGGVAHLLNWAEQSGQALPTVYGPAGEDIKVVTDSLMQGDSVHLEHPASLFWVLDVPGHTAGHIAYYTEIGDQKHLFCGDTLFASGCGRLFEGTPKQMLASLDKFKNLPDETLVHCAHEYTLSNIKFALTVEPKNQDLLEWKSKAESLRRVGKSTLPTTIAHEKLVNPFLRCDTSSVITAVQRHCEEEQLKPSKICEPVEVFAVLRAWKDIYK